jgi:hypothetical protein
MLILTQAPAKLVVPVKRSIRLALVGLGERSVKHVLTVLLDKIVSGVWYGTLEWAHRIVASMLAAARARDNRDGYADIAAKLLCVENELRAALTSMTNYDGIVDDADPADAADWEAIWA